MTSYRKQIIVVFTLLLLTAQFSTLVHAADHPFHVHDDSCSVYLNFEHQNLVDTSAASLITTVASDGICGTLAVSAIVSELDGSSLARAPPCQS